MGAWIETQHQEGDLKDAQSHPIWVRGLKQRCNRCDLCRQASHPIWVRGLKPTCSCRLSSVLLVAPHMGAWIETRCAV